VFQALVASRRRPRVAWAEARRRWDRPIEATLEVGGPFNRLPRWPFQVAAVGRRTLELLRALRAIARRRRDPRARLAARAGVTARAMREISENG
jgi:hypothetical protein